MSKTIGEFRVRTQFNPSDDRIVEQIKQKTAELINLCESLRVPILQLPKPNMTEQTLENDKFKTGEKYRLISTAQTNFETAAMYAVKAATAE